MLRTVSSPDDWDDYVQPVAIEQGGTGGHSASESLTILNAIPASKIGKANGPIPIGPDGGIDPKFLGSNLTGITGIDGDRYISAGETKEYIITTYDCFTNYIVEALSGSISRKGNILTYTAGNRPGNSGFRINGRLVTITIGGDGVVIPQIISPVANAINRPTTMEFASTDFTLSGFSYTDTHVSSDWQISKSDLFTTIAKSVTGSVEYKTAWEVSDLELETDYYVRVRHTGAKFGTTDWSTPVRFRTKASADAAVITYPYMAQDEIGDKITFITGVYSPDKVAVQVPVYVAGVIANHIEVLSSSQHESTDWQISSVSSFASIDLSGHVTDSLLTKEILGLNPANVYYLRVRHNHTYKTPISADANNVITYETSQKLGEWSDVVAFTTMGTFEAAAPTITAPGAGTANHGPSTTAMASEYISPVFDTHASTDWEVATDSLFTNIVKSSYADSVNKLSWTMNDIPAGYIYYLRVRYKGSKYTQGRWSNIVAFSTLPTYSPNQPVITSPANNSIGISSSLTATSSSYVSPMGHQHVSSDWELSLVTDFSTLEQSSHEDTVNKTMWGMAGLSTDKTYYLRVRYNDEAGYKSNWSNILTFSTLQTKPLKPVIASPSEGSEITDESYLVSASSFSHPGNVHANSDWEIYNADTSALLQSSYFDTVNKTTITLTTLAAQNLKVRVRYRTGTGVSSDWSEYRSYRHTYQA